ncbi:hypothetical protein E4U54_002755 [Claviceps lovelessii]|nr:hypothetical protein E4U54_002755 [Claviceps lovelessii]
MDNTLPLSKDGPLMERPHHKKRQHSDELLQSRPPSKRARCTVEDNFSPEFWDELSKIYLTTRALRELDRRNTAHSIPPHIAPKEYPKQLARFSRHGGPDLDHLRGYPEPIPAMSSGTFPAPQSQGTESTAPAMKPVKLRKSSAYDTNFDNRLIEHSIYPEDYEHPPSRATPEPSNMSQTHQELTNPRASLSPSRFSKSAFRDFKRKIKRRAEGSIIRNVIPMIAGASDTPNDGPLMFCNLESLTNDTTVAAVPDFFDGARQIEIQTVVRRDLDDIIIPTNHANAPVLPNFFLEVKGPTGNAHVAKRQACYDGAHGARAMQALQNYRETEPVYDGNAYTYSSIYDAGSSMLELYAHHVTAPMTTDQRPEYHMTRLRSFALVDSREAFIQGATAFRNARDSAERFRNSMIQTANSKAAQATAANQEGAAETHEQVSGPIEVGGSGDCMGHTPWQDADDALQQQIADGSEHTFQDDAEVGTTASQLSSTEASRPMTSQESVAVTPEVQSMMSFASSFTSFTAGPKRLRESVSPSPGGKRIRLSQDQNDKRTLRQEKQSSQLASAAM